MISELFLPLFFGEKRILSQKILSFTVSDTHVNGALVIATSAHSTIKHIVSRAIDPEKPREKALAETIAGIAKECYPYDSVRVAISASLAIFKEITLPFIEAEKIRMVLPYEIEPLLPFAVTEATIDFIITSQNLEAKNSNVLVVAIRTADIERTLKPFMLAGVTPNSATVDIFALYGLYLQLKPYRSLTGISALIDIGSRTTRVAFIHNGELKFIRNLQKGTNSLVRFICEDTGMPTEQVAKFIEESGVSQTGNTAYDESLKKHLLSFFSDIQFTLNSFSLKLNSQATISKLIFTGALTDFDQLITSCADFLQVPCEELNVEYILNEKEISFDKSISSTDKNNHVADISSALILPSHQNFDVRGPLAQTIDAPFVGRQFITAGVLLCTLAFSIVGQGYLQLSSLMEQAQAFENREIKKLINIFPEVGTSKKQKTLKNLVKIVSDSLAEKQQSWNTFVPHSIKPLDAMIELTRMIDKHRFDITVEKVIIAKNELDQSPRITLDGLFKSKTDHHFGDFDSLEKRWRNEFKALAIVGGIENEVASDAQGVKFSAKMRLRDL